MQHFDASDAADSAHVPSSSSPLSTTFAHAEQSPLPAAPWSPQPCPLNCSGRGTCHEDTGMCLCAMGRAGSGCELPDPFPCNLPHGEQLVNRCAGHCNLESSKCTCGGGRFPGRSMHKCEFMGMGKYIQWDGPGWDYARTARSPAQLWSRATDAPAYLSRHPAWTRVAPKQGREVAWCDADPQEVMRGRERPLASCTCNEGMTGALCEVPVLMGCLNQCNGRGKCAFGFCECDPSWYGVDCSMHRGAVSVQQPTALPAGGGTAGAAVYNHADLAAAARARPSATSPPPPPPPPPPPSPSHAHCDGGSDASTLSGAGGARDAVPSPAIFVYELPIEFNVRLWTLKHREEDCALRAYTRHNTTDWKQHAFGMEVALHERLLHSPHRVSDPTLADYFYVPVWGGCWLSRFSRPTPRHHDLASMAGLEPHIKTPRAVRASDFYRRAYQYIRQAYPFWNRSGGADHLWTFPHDEGACLAPAEIAPSILVSHWGRLMLRPNNHTSTSTGQGWHMPPFHERMYGALRCFEPGKDVLLPIFKSRSFVQASPFVTGRAVRRNVLFNFRGNAHLNQPRYSLGLRQQLYTLLASRSDRCVCADPGMSGESPPPLAAPVTNTSAAGRRRRPLPSPDAIQFTSSTAVRTCATARSTPGRDVLGDAAKCKGEDVDGCLLVGGHSRDYIADLQRSVFCGVLPGNGSAQRPARRALSKPLAPSAVPLSFVPTGGDTSRSRSYTAASLSSSCQGSTCKWKGC